MRHDVERSHPLHREDASTLDGTRPRVAPQPGDSLDVERPDRVPELDALRGIGALMILFYHLWPTSFFLGWTRADFFFVLSGYLVTANVLRFEPGFRPVLAFWVKRALRILPAYYLMLVIAAASALAGGRLDAPGSIVAHVIFVQDIPRYWSEIAYRLPGTVQTWSLAIEVQFYIVWPLIFGCFGRSALAPFALTLAADAVASRVLGLSPAVAFARCDGLALGSLLALIQYPTIRSEQLSRRLDLVLFVTGLSALAFASTPVAPFDPPIAEILGCTSSSLFAVNVFYLSLIGLTVRHSGRRLLAPLRNRILRHLGLVSYGIYLYHVIIIDLVRVHVYGRFFFADAVAAVLSIMVAIASWNLVERPCANAFKPRSS